MTAPAGDQVRQVIGQLQISSQGHMQAAENLLAQVGNYTTGADDLQPGDVIAWALAHAVIALAYELGAPPVMASALSSQPASIGASQATAAS